MLYQQLIDNVMHDAWSHIHYNHINKCDEWIENRVTIGEYDEYSGCCQKVEFASTFYGYEESIKSFLISILLKKEKKIQERFLNTDRKSFAVRSSLPEEIEGNLYNGLRWEDCSEAVIILEKTANFFRIKTAYPEV